MNTLTIKNYKEYVDKQALFKRHGFHVNGTYELSPCVVEIEAKVIDGLADTYLFLNHKEVGWPKLLAGLMNVTLKGADFTAISGSEYIGKDYKSVLECFNSYKNDKESDKTKEARRRFNYMFNEKLCMYGMQIFEDRGILILNFRSCDYIKKLPFDLLLIYNMVQIYGLNIKKFYCNFGSLHIYEKDFDKLVCTK